MNKILGYAFSFVGVVGLILTFDAVKKALKITLPSFLSTTFITIVSLVLLAVGIFLLLKGRASAKASEVPIYEGKQIVGYRRV